MRHKLLLILVIFSIHNTANSSEKSPWVGDDDYFKMFLIAEGLIIANAYMASEEPGIYGGTLALFAPIAGPGDNQGEAMQWILLGLAETIAIHNLSIDRNEKSKKEIFEENMIAWHAYAGITIALNYFLVPERQQSRLSMDYRPTSNNGHLLTFNYRF